MLNHVIDNCIGKEYVQNLWQYVSYIDLRLRIYNTEL